MGGVVCSLTLAFLVLGAIGCAEDVTRQSPPSFAMTRAELRAEVLRQGGRVIVSFDLSDAGDGEDASNCPVDCKSQVCGNQVCEPTDGGPAVQECRSGECRALFGLLGRYYDGECFGPSTSASRVKAGSAYGETHYGVAPAGAGDLVMMQDDDENTWDDRACTRDMHYVCETPVP